MNIKKVDIFTSAADLICMDGTVVNKVGTFQIALCCDYFKIPYYVTRKPNEAHPDRNFVTIEEREPEFVLQALGTRSGMAGVKGYYPAFDFTPPEIVAGVVTDKGCLSTSKLFKYYGENK